MKSSGRSARAAWVKCTAQRTHGSTALYAIKILSAHADARRFEQEARVISGLSHSNICTLFDVGQQNGIGFLVMEYLEGETLAARLKNGKPPAEQVMQFAREILDGLDHAHRRGVIHRDLKPANVMLVKSGARQQPSCSTSVLPRSLRRATPLRRCSPKQE
jgi:serine/threonine protein kinase